MKTLRRYILPAAIAVLAATILPLQAQHVCNIDQALQSGQPVYASGELGNLHTDNGRLLFEVPLKYMGRECLLSSCIARTTHYKWMAVGTRSRFIHVRLATEGENVYLKEINTSVTTDAASVSSVSDSYMDGYLAKLPVMARSEEKQSVTIDVTDLFLTDRTLSPFPWYFDRTRTTIEPDLCRLMVCKVFDDNLSVRTLYSFRYPASDEAPAGVCSAEVVHSLLLLPEEKMRPRIADSRVGLFTQQKKQLDFSTSDFYRSIAYAQRWRIEPSDWKAWQQGDTVAPTKPIVYYLDNEFPESWKEPLRQGILKWNEAFGRFGLKDVIQVRDYPTDDPDFDEDNLKYSCIRYVATDRGAAQGPSWADPTTGELLSASVYVWASLPEIMNRFCFVQTAQANPAIRSGRLSEEEMSIALQNIITHEIGHTLGMAHNMGGSAAYPVDSLLNADFVRRNGLSASVMDYLYYNYLVPPERTDIPCSSACLGPYDELCLEYIYRPTSPWLSVEEDQKTAEAWIDAHAGDPHYRYGIQQWGNRYDPTSLTDDISNDALAAGNLAIGNLKYVLSHMEEWLSGGEHVAQRKDMYTALVKQYTSLLKHALYNVGGIYLNFVKEGTPGKIYAPVASERQKQALAWVANEIRQSAWLDNRTLTSKFEVALDASVQVQNEIAKEIVSVSENVVLSAHLSQQPYGLKEYTDDLYELFFAAPMRNGTLSQADKVLQHSLLQAMLQMTNPQATKEHVSFFNASADYADACTAFAFRTDGGYLDNIPVSLISEQKAYFRLLMKRVQQLAISQIKSGKEEDKAHWTLIDDTLHSEGISR